MSRGQSPGNEIEQAVAGGLSVKNLKVQIRTRSGTVEAVRDVSFELEPGTTLGLLGSSGSGKSVSGLSILGLPPGGRESIVGGSIRLGGLELTSLREEALREIRGGRIAMVFQDPGTALTPVHTIGRLLGDTIKAHLDFSGAQTKNRAQDLLREVGFPDPAAIAGSYVQQLSGGMQQRAMIAIALAGEPSVLIADEPTSALDAIAQDQILGLLESIQDQRALSLLLISHDLGVVARMADTVTVIERGRTVESGSTAALLSEPKERPTRALVAAQRTEALGRLKAPLTDPKPILKMDRIEFTYPTKETPSVRGVSIDVAPGEILGLVGESGCGKTTLARCALRILEPDEGMIMVDGIDIGHLSERALRPIRGRIGSVFQNPGASLNPRHRVERILRPIPESGSRTDRRSRRSAAIAALASVGLDESHLERLPSELSGGQQQRVALARALINDPVLLVCDEPFTALDLAMQNQMASLLKSVQEERGLACLFIAHDLTVTRQIADRVAVMQDGVIVEVGETERTFSDPRAEFTRRLVEASERSTAAFPARSPAG
jgi:peptide/nickel transport system ATP-binding protein